MQLYTRYHSYSTGRWYCIREPGLSGPIDGHWRDQRVSRGPRRTNKFEGVWKVKVTAQLSKDQSINMDILSSTSYSFIKKVNLKAILTTFQMLC